MIVRPMQHADGRAGWLLIAQQDHANLAFDLCQGWRPLLEFADSPALESAILHHDDGWQSWDAEPGIDPKSGLPRDFLNMELAAVLPMWTASIEEAARHSPLAAYAVSGHFAALLEQSSLAEQLGNAEPSGRFLESEARRRTRALEHWLFEDPATPGMPRRTSAGADWALACLQHFDRFSLWLCCGESREAARLPLASGGEILLNPLTPYDIQAEPWNWEVPQVRVSVAGWWIADRTYRDAADLLAAREERQQLSWLLRPSA